MSSVSQAALLTDLMHVSVDQDDMEPPPGMERKVIGKSISGTVSGSRYRLSNSMTLVFNSHNTITLQTILSVLFIMVALVRSS